MNIPKTLISVCALSGLMACQSPSNEDKLMEAGVSHELATFRKEHFSDVRYHLFFSIPESKDEPVRGQEELTLRMGKGEPLILDFRAEAEQVHAVTLNGSPVAYEVRNEHIHIPAGVIPEGEHTVSISFTANDQSLNRRDEFLYTLLVPDRARTVFPCFDQPNIKALFTLELETPDTWQAVANGAIQAVDSLAGRNHTVFRETEPLSTYLFSFVAGKFNREFFTREGRDISIYHRETDPKKAAQCPDIADEVFDALEWLEDYTGIPYPFAKYDLIIIPGFQFSGMEHTGATLYTDRRLFLNENPTLSERLSRSALINHETAHMWFGDYVTMDWFDDVWTKEVFANYFASRITAPKYPEVNHRLNFIRDYIPLAYFEDRTAGSNPIKQDLDNLSNAGLVYGNIIYDKSPVIMEMLTRILGEDAFRQGIHEYLTTYAYANATWEGLIQILDAYTETDLVAWSDVWVHEKGMPTITATVEEGELTVTQSDPWERGMLWPQELRYRILSSKGVEDVSISLNAETSLVHQKLRLDISDGEGCLIIPNTDGRGYGFFQVSESEAEGLWKICAETDDDLLRGSLLITLYENLRHKTLSPETFRDAILAYLPREANSLLFNMAVGYLSDCQRIFPRDPRPVEKGLWEIVESPAIPQQQRLQAFRAYRTLADSEEAIQTLYDLWQGRRAVGITLSESDRISLSYTLAIHLPERADAIVATQLESITNPDRRKEYAFIAPSVSPRREVRDSVFASLLQAENRRVEPYASTALANLNHPKREQESIAYIRPALEALPDVQRTGDIFFPTSWLRALLSGHVSEEARQEVEAFFTDHPDFSPMLTNKINHQAGHLR